MKNQRRAEILASDVQLLSKIISILGRHVFVFLFTFLVDFVLIQVLPQSSHCCNACSRYIL